jgi:hypothetical protein
LFLTEKAKYRIDSFNEKMGIPYRAKLLRQRGLI